MSHPHSPTAANLAEVKRNMEIKEYEVNELTSKLTKANEAVRKLGDATDELEVLRKEIANLQQNAAAAKADKIKADAMLSDLRIELENTMEQSKMKESEMMDL